MFKLYDYQQKMIDDARKLMKSGIKNIAMIAPPGAGKSVVIAEIARMTTNNGKRVLFFVHRQELVDQIKESLIQQDVSPELSSVMMVGKVKNHLNDLPKPDLIITDEAQHARAKTYIDIFKILKNALANKDGLAKYSIKIEDETLLAIAKLSGGDVRTALNTLELAVLTTEMNSDGKIEITTEIAANCMGKKKTMFDKSGDSHYDNISAFIKSMRGSDPDATIFYLARAIDGGEDPVFLARRITIAASEDVGLANPNALVVATSAMQAVANVGMPEARIILAEAALYIALSKKSNCAYIAIDKALEDVSNKDTGEIPMHIRNAPAQEMSKLGYGVGYKYPHDYPKHQVEQQYLPDKMLGTKYFIKDDTIE